MSDRTQRTGGSARWEQLQALFHEAADLSPDQQDAFFARHQHVDPALLNDVRAMLAEDRGGHRLIDDGVAQLAHSVLTTGALPPDGSFGRYRVSRLLGEGGMGVVYQAQRDDLGSTVAIKVLRDAWLSPSRRDRFIAEQRTLAQLNHPSIAALYDADALPDGTPYFVMEYVEGEPLTTFCRERVPDTRERLTLFREVCEAVQHAHEHLVIHRDLKPSNILVKGDGSVKLLDFGIARQLDEHARPMDRTMTGLRLMTPAYASPQQIRGEATGVDTDVYSLGVILYELLADCPPFDFTSRTPAEAESLVLEREPERPSVAARRDSALSDRPRSAGLSGSAWADLDVLCLTAMHKDTARRYRTVQAVIRDVDHFLDGEPLDARPDGFGYRAGKFARRNRLPLSIAGAAIGGLVGLAAFYTFRLTRARNQALNEAARAQRIQQFMLNLFEGGDTEAGPAEDLRVTTLLDRGVQEADSLASEPAAQADLYQTLGRLYQKLGQFDRADDLFARALEARHTLFGPDSSQVGDTIVAQADLRTDQARYDEAERLAREALTRAQSTLSHGHPLVASAGRTLGRVLQERGQYEAAIPVLESALRQLESAGDLLQLANTAHELANVEFYAGHYDASAALNHRALAIYRQQFGDRHPHVGDTIINLGAVEFERGDDVRAEELYREGLAVTEAWYGSDHFRTANNLVMLGRTLTRRDKLEEASEVLARALAGRERTYGSNHPSVASVLNELGTIARKRSRLDEAEASYRRMESIYRSIYGDTPHYLIGIAVSNLGTVSHLRGDFATADRQLRDAIAIFEATQGPTHANTAIARVKLAAALVKQARAAEARDEAIAARDLLGKTMKADAFWMLEARKALAESYDALNDAGRAEAIRAGVAGD